MKKKMKVKRPARVEVDNPQPLKHAKTTMMVPTPVVVALGAPIVPKVHQDVVTEPALMDAEVQEEDDEFDPLLTYPSPSCVVTLRNNDGETLVEWVECPLPE